jgi:hypothetical protein
MATTYTKWPPHIPNGPKYTKWANNIPNGQKIYQMGKKYTKWAKNIPNGQKIYQHLPLQDPPKFTHPNKNWDLWFENMPSGNPDKIATEHVFP